MVQQGKSLFQAREIVGEAQFDAWLKKHFPKPASVASQYIQQTLKLGDNPSAKVAGDPKAMKHAMKAAGLLPQSPEPVKSGPSDAVAPDPLFSAINGAIVALTQTRDQIPGWSEQRKQQLKMRLKPLADLYATLP
jgi:hypothetical protein